MLLWIFWYDWIIYIWRNFYQLGISQLNVSSKILFRKPCNRCQAFHKKFDIAIERLYLNKTCTIDVQEELQLACVTHYEEFGNIKSFEFVKNSIRKDNA